MSDYSHWVIPTAGDREYVPDEKTLAGIVSRLQKAGWITIVNTSPYDPTGFYMSSFPGPSDLADVKIKDPRYDLSAATEPVIRPSHCRSVTVMVTDTLLVAPTADAQVACSRCGEALLLAAEPGTSRRAPEECASCGAAIDARQLSELPLFRFAIVIELWHPPGRADLTVDPELLILLRTETGRSFRETRQDIT